MALETWKCPKCKREIDIIEGLEYGDVDCVGEGTMGSHPVRRMKKKGDKA